MSAAVRAAGRDARPRGVVPLIGLATVVRRSLFHYRVASLAVALAVCAASGTLTGALLVGDSMRGSLRALALTRLGRVDAAVMAESAFREELADALRADLTAGAAGSQGGAAGATALAVQPVLLARGSATNPVAHQRAGAVTVFGVRESFFSALEEASARSVAAVGPASPTGLADRHGIVLNEAAARELRVVPGDDVLVRVDAAAIISAETLFGRRDRPSVAMRLTVSAVQPAGVADFTLAGSQAAPLNVFVPIGTLQQRLGVQGRANLLLAASNEDRADPAEVALRDGLRRSAALEDFAIRVRVDAPHNAVVVESDALLVPPVVERTVRDAAAATGAEPVGVAAYLANELTVCPPPAAASSAATTKGAALTASTTAPAAASIPYSTVAAFDVNAIQRLAPLRLVDGSPAPSPRRDEMLLNEWAAAELQARPGEQVEMAFYVLNRFGALETRRARFTVAGVVQLAGAAADRGLMPAYAGVTDAKNITDWDPPFPIDMRRIRPQDEAYWDAHGPTPKAFIAPVAAEALWSHEPERFGRLTSVRIGPPRGRSLEQTAEALRRELRGRLADGLVGLRIEPVRERALAAARGGTDFGLLFVGFSLFLIVAAVLLVGLLLRLHIERRAAETGLLLALGLPASRVSRLWVAQALVPAGAGTSAGLAAAAGYAALMLAGLQSWWSDAVVAPRLALFVPPTSLVIGAGATLLIVAPAVMWALRGLLRASPRALLAGASPTATVAHGVRRGRVRTTAVLACAVLVSVPWTLPQAGPQWHAILFFLAGVALLALGLLLLSGWLAGGGRRRRPIRAAAPLALALRETRRNPRRSLLAAGLMAAAAFVLVAVGASRRQVDAADLSLSSGVGGFTLLGETTSGIVHDLNTPAGRDELNLGDDTRGLLDAARVFPLRLFRGEEASCLNLLAVSQPRVLGATAALIERGGFSFAGSLAESAEERAQPWRLLRRSYSDGAIPAIGDANTVRWLLHSGLGQDVHVSDGSGRRVPLRVVALLAGSLLQGELVIGEAQFLRLFPRTSGYGFFLIEAPSIEHARQLAPLLERDLAAFGLDVTFAADRLQAFLSVEHAYLSAFMALGGLGLALGALGLAAVLLRSVHERRGELALMRAVGFRRSRIAVIIALEAALLLGAGLLVGTVSAAMAVAPHALGRAAGGIPWLGLGRTLGIVVAAAMASTLLAVRAALRAPVVATLRAERV